MTTTLKIAGATVSSWISRITDAQIKSDIQSFTLDGDFSRADAIQLFSNLASRGSLTTDGLLSLKIFASNLNYGFTVSSYVASTLQQIINGSPANATWNGGALTATPLGNLAVGSTATQITQLVGKWILGTDNPAASLTDWDAARSDGTGQAPTMKLIKTDYSTDNQGGSYVFTTDETLTYKSLSLPLFSANSGVSVHDVAQGSVGDCGFWSAALLIAQNHKDTLTSMFVDNGDGSYGVRFYVNGAEKWVTVNNQLPYVETTGSFTYTDKNGKVFPSGVITPQENLFYARQVNPVLWPQLLEKAYAELCATGYATKIPGINAYQQLYFISPVDVLKAVINQPSNTYINLTESNSGTVKQQMISALNAGLDVTVGTFKETLSDTGQTRFVGNHAFAILGYNKQTDKFTIRNPWGDAGIGYLPQFEATYDEIKAACSQTNIGESSANNFTFKIIDGIAGWGLPDGNGVRTIASFGPAVSYTTPTPIFNLFTISSTAGREITKYKLSSFDAMLYLNGAVNLASASEIENGQFVVSKEDLSKVTLQAIPPADGTFLEPYLRVAAFDGQNWSNGNVIKGAISAQDDFTKLIHTHIVFAPVGAEVPILDLFSVTPSVGSTAVINLQPQPGLTVNLNGAVNLGSPGSYVIKASDLGVVTASAAGNGALLSGWIMPEPYSQWLPAGTAAISTRAENTGIKTTVAGAIQNYSNGIVSPQTVTDNLATILENINALQTIFSAGAIDAIKISGTTTQPISISVTQFVNNKVVLGFLPSVKDIHVDGVSVAALGTFQKDAGTAASHIHSLSITDTVSNIVASMTMLQSMKSNGQIQNISVLDTASNIEASTTTLQSMLSKGQIQNFAVYTNNLPTGTVTVTGSAVQGQTLTASNTLADIDGLGSITYQWQSAGKNIPGATNSSYTLTQADVGKSITVTANYTDGFGAGESVTSYATKSVGGFFVGTPNGDTLIGGAGNDTLDGMGGIDTASFSLNISNYRIGHVGNVYTVTDKTGTDGTDTLNNVEILQFRDMSVNLTVQMTAASAPQANVQRLMELYVAFFNRVPDADGLAYWIGQMKAGQTINQIAETFYNAGVAFSDLTHFTATMSNTDFINIIYKNVLGRNDGADQDGLNYWNAKLMSGTARGTLVSTILDSAHSFKGDTTWGWVANLLDNKITVSQVFAIDLGLNYLTPADSISRGMAIAAAVTPTDTNAALSLIGISTQELSLH